MAELYQLQEQEIPEAMAQLQESYKNLSKVADYCEGFYLSTENKEKRAALEQTRGYTTQALASVAYQINTLATSFLSLLDLQANQLVEMESNINHLAQTVSIQKEKVARREIGVLTTNKSFYRPVGVKSPGIIFPEQSEKPIKYVRKPIDFSVLDSIGQGGCKVQRTAQFGGGTLPRPTSGGASNTISTAHIRNGPATVSNTLARRHAGDNRVTPPTVPEYMSAHQLQQMSQRTSRDPGYSTMTNTIYSHGAGATPVPPPAPPAMNPSLVGPQYNGMDMAPPSPPLPPMPTPDELDMPRQSLEMPAPPPPPPLPAPDMLSTGMGSEFPLPDYHDDDNESSVSASDRSTQRESIPPPPPPANEDPDPIWAPQSYIEKVMAIYDYEPQNDDELKFREHAVIYVINKNSDGWWEGVMEHNGQSLCGLFPENYVESLL